MHSQTKEKAIKAKPIPHYRVTQFSLVSKILTDTNTKNAATWKTVDKEILSLNEYFALSTPGPLAAKKVIQLSDAAIKTATASLVDRRVRKILGRAVSIQKANPTIRRLPEDRPLDARKLGHNSSREEVRKRLQDGASSADSKLRAKPIVVIAPCAPESTPRQTTTNPDSSFHSTTADPSNSKGSDTLEEASLTWSSSLINVLAAKLELLCEALTDANTKKEAIWTKVDKELSSLNEYFALSTPGPLAAKKVIQLSDAAIKTATASLVDRRVRKILGRAVSIQKANPTIRRLPEDRPLDARKLGHNSSREEVRKRLQDGASSADSKLKAKPIVVIAPCAPESTPRQTTTNPDSSFHSTTADPSSSKGSDDLEEASLTWTGCPKYVELAALLSGPDSQSLKPDHGEPESPSYAQLATLIAGESDVHPSAKERRLPPNKLYTILQIRKLLTGFKVQSSAKLSFMGAPPKELLGAATQRSKPRSDNSPIKPRQNAQETKQTHVCLNFLNKRKAGRPKGVIERASSTSG
ncbi:hypothetical protein CLF_109527 [Clonorchis sinensis]|uniref:Uncharacterized protein n=1 Tax=Clonorchis sinensis TaxID=79923 RepID=G7YJG6_CLOSI|nr:hypothetical protein CLF_109527 [Clonorchis sinensis]